MLLKFAKFFLYTLVDHSKLSKLLHATNLKLAVLRKKLSPVKSVVKLPGLLYEFNRIKDHETQTLRIIINFWQIPNLMHRLSAFAGIMDIGHLHQG